MSLKRSISQNTVTLLTSQVISLTIGFIYTVYIARYLSVEEFGVLSLAIALISVLGVFVDFGLNILMTREIARDRTSAHRYIDNIFSIKFILILIVIPLTILIINMVGYSQKTVNVIYILLLSFIFTTFSTMLYSFFQSYENLKYQSTSVILSSVLILFGVFIAIYYKFNVVGIAFVYSVVALIIFIYNLIVSHKTFFLPRIGRDKAFCKNIIPLALQFGLISVFSTIYVWVDSLMLSFMQGPEAVGLYNVSYRIVLILLFVPIVINTAIFPVMARLYESSKNSLRKIVSKYFKFMILIGIPLGTGTTILSNKIILLIFGSQYSPSIPALQILVWATVFTFISAAFVQLFQSINKQMIVTKITFIGLVLNIILNLILIPKISFIGASIDTLITELTVAILLIIVADKTIYKIKREFLSDLTKIVISSLLMGIFIWIFRDMSLLILIPVAIALYLLISYKIKVINEEDIKIISKIRG